MEQFQHATPGWLRSSDVLRSATTSTRAERFHRFAERRIGEDDLMAMFTSQSQTPPKIFLQLR
jgi:hypothetical protein